MTKFNVSSNLARCSFKDHLIGWNIIIIVLENIVFIDESDFQRKVVENEISLLHRKITIAKRLRCFSIYDSFSFWFWGEADGELPFWGFNNSGIARINLYKKYPESLKVVHLLPALFTIGIVFLLLCSLVCSWSLSLLLLFALIICVDSTLRNKSFKIGLLSILASFIQLIGYGTGFLRAWWKRCVLGKNEFAAFEKNFYK